MKQLQEKLLALLLMALLSGTEAPDKQKTPDKVVVFRFLLGEEMFSLKGNEAELERLYMLVEKYGAEITAGGMPVYVDGYCASLPTAKENLNTAFARANRVKSELITQKGLKEADFITANYARAYHNNKDLVVVTLRIPSAKATTGTSSRRTKNENRRGETIRTLHSGTTACPRIGATHPGNGTALSVCRPHECVV